MFIRLGCALVLFASIQFTSPQPQSTGLIVGQVVDAASGRPVSGAIVAAGGPPGPNAQPLPRVITGNDGRFVFRDLRRGNYTITATKPGFAEGAYGRYRAGGPSSPLTLNDGERVGNVTIRLWRYASISGTVVDESGERLVGVQVRAFRRSVVAGRRRYLSSTLGTTDDRGIYRIGNLLPGDYIVATISRQTIIPLSFVRNWPASAGERSIPFEVAAITAGETSALLQLGDAGLVLGRGIPTPPPVANGRLAMYPATFHPSTTQGGAGTVITLRPGEEHVNADLQLTPVPTVRVSGTIFGPEGPLTRTNLRLEPGNTTELSAELDLPNTLTDPGGNFIFPAVPSGHYTLRISPRGGPVWLDEPLSVGTENLDNLTLAAKAGVRVGGRVDFEGAARIPPMSNIQILIEPAEAVLGGAMHFAPPRADGTFMSAPLPGGRYYVRIQNSPAGWMFKSAAIEGRDVADVPLDLRQEPTSVVITFTDRWSGVRGLVQPLGASENSMVIVFPSDRDAWGSSGVSPRRVRSTRPNATGEYSFNLPAGDYYIAAIPLEQSADWQDPEFLDAVSRNAARFTIVEGERKVQDLRTREVR